jgi:hypothetical protein
VSVRHVSLFLCGVLYHIVTIAWRNVFSSPNNL